MVLWKALLLCAVVIIKEVAAAGKRLLLIGETGAGKSFLANTIICDTKFMVSGGADSCTTLASGEEGKLFCDGTNVEVVDTPGLGDSEGRDREFIAAMADHVRKVGGVHGIVYAHNACVKRFNQGTQDSLELMLSAFTDESTKENLWRYLGVVFTQCPITQYWAKSWVDHFKKYIPVPPEVKQVPFFWTGADSVLESAMQEYFGQAGGKFAQLLRSTFGKSTWQGEFAKWVDSLPKVRFNVPSAIHVQIKLYPPPPPPSIVQLPPPPSPPPKNNNCFCGESTVILKDQGRVLLKQVQPGDYVLTKGGYTKVIAWMHRDELVNGVLAKSIVSAAGKLVLTPNHFLFVQRSFADAVTIPAQSVSVGDMIFAGESGTPSNVTSIANVTLRGALAPLTASGDLLVDGTLASCYISMGLPHGLVHLITWGWRNELLPQWLTPQKEADWLELGNLVQGLLSFFGL